MSNSHEGGFSASEAVSFQPIVETAEAEKSELNESEKKMLAQAWCAMVIDSNEPINLEGKNNEEVRQELFRSLMADTDRLLTEWGDSN